MRRPRLGLAVVLCAIFGAAGCEAAPSLPSSGRPADGLLDDHGVAALAGESFGEYGDGCVRFSFANSAENIERALERIERFVASKA